MKCARCDREMTESSIDRVCPRCALSRALNFAPAGGPVATALEGYELLHELGRGAMGVVWLAREHALDRLVALKVIAAAGDPLLAARLQREGQAVARLSHPNIIAIHSLGGSGANTFLAMDFAEGGNLAARLDGKPLDAPSAARLLAKLAGAVAHAHAAGIVHRDLKPSNVLLSASGEPQLADFGLAGPLEGRGELTRSGQVVGTPAYLAPELLGNSGAATPAADVYGLGAVLYFCLTARAPFVADSTAALLHQVATADPVSPRLLQPGVPRDLETICLKCLNKAPGARYASAAMLREDLERFLRHEPIAARPLGRWGKTLRWSRRHPNAAAGLGLAAIVTLLFAIGGPLVALRLARERRTAESAAAEAKAINEFLQGDLLGQASALGQFVPDLKLRAAIDRASLAIDRRFGAEPAIRASLHETLARAYASLGESKAARSHLAEALRWRQQNFGPDDPATLRLRSGLAETYLVGSPPNFPLAEAFARRSWEQQRRRLGPEHQDTQLSQIVLANSLRYQGKYREAEALMIPLVALQRHGRGQAMSEAYFAPNELAAIFLEEGKFGPAEALAKANLEDFRRKFGPDNLGALRAMNALAVIYTRTSRPEEAVPLGRELVERYQRTHGPENTLTLTAMNNLGSTLLLTGGFDESLALFEKLRDVRTRVSGPNDPETLVVLGQLAYATRNLGRYAEAENYAQTALAGFERAVGPNHPFTLTCRLVLASVYKLDGRPREAEPLVRTVLAGRQKVLGPGHPETLMAETELGDVLLRENRFAEAEPVLRETLDLAAKIPWEEWKKSLARSRLGEALLGQDKSAEATPLLRDGLQGLEANRNRLPVTVRFEIDRARERLARAEAGH